jgi:hypothetical protein
MLDACCNEAEIPPLAGIKTLPFTAPGNIINLFYGPFRKIKKVIKFFISSSIQKPASSIFILFAPQYIETQLKINDLGLYRRLVGHPHLNGLGTSLG